MGHFDRPRAANGGAPRAVSPTERIERTFLALCIALPTHGRDALAKVTEEHFSSALLWRAAEHLREHIDTPDAGIGEGDELEPLIRELSVRAARGNPPPETLRVEALQLELARLDRAIAHAKAEGHGGVSTLVVEHGAVKERLDAAIEAALEASAPHDRDD